MKKVILTSIASGLFMLALVFTMNTSTVTFGEQAFADGTCCSEATSTCITGGFKVDNAYLKDSGSCFEVKPVDTRPVNASPVNN